MLREQWQKEYPDARPRHRTGDTRGPLGIYEKVYCVNCGTDGGLITRGLAEHILYLCEGCAKEHGGLPLPEVSVRGGE